MVSTRETISSANAAHLNSEWTCGNAAPCLSRPPEEVCPFGEIKVKGNPRHSAAQSTGDRENLTNCLTLGDSKWRSSCTTDG